MTIERIDINPLNLNNYVKVSVWAGKPALDILDMVCDPGNESLDEMKEHMELFVGCDFHQLLNYLKYYEVQYVDIERELDELPPTEEQCWDEFTDYRNYERKGDYIVDGGKMAKLTDTLKNLIWNTPTQNWDKIKINEWEEVI